MIALRDEGSSFLLRQIRKKLFGCALRRCEIETPSDVLADRLSRAIGKDFCGDRFTTRFELDQSSKGNF